ncbi:hypothetical protein LJ928_004275 [Salmonella enterica]|nr:hypothetical protein [Salmonella enterica]EGI0930417.1 hypothetical protein [Salmonella enterica]EIJ0690047.1 hypothetical protein [Salmonella enterica]EIJ6077329.1 hypothetical protein [Salmonella enterica]EIJ6084270.1 hypothetical protein [Salmonella enterica]
MPPLRRMQERAAASCRVFMPEATAGIVAMAVYKKQKPGCRPGSGLSAGLACYRYLPRWLQWAHLRAVFNACRQLKLSQETLKYYHNFWVYQSFAGGFK